MTSAHRWSWSCDTFAVRPNDGAPDVTIFGKNSDRPARECQPLRRVGARSGAGVLRLAYVEIEDISETIAHLGSSPYWCWGHEMGVNAAGVAIGNEALFTRELASTVSRVQRGETMQPGILGMEMVRIALERATTSGAAIELMTDLLERHGQWGAGTVSDSRVDAAYDNSYLVADKDAVWVLETVGRRWAARQVREAFWSLSNEPTIRHSWDDSAADLVDHLVARGWATSPDRVDLAETIADPLVPLQVSHIRLQRSRQLLAEVLRTHGQVGFHDARRLLSDHYEDSFLAGPRFNPARPDFHTLCMHEHPSGFTWGNTAASMIALLPQGRAPHLWWAAGTPCTSIYIPVSVASRRLPEVLGRAGLAEGTGPNPEQAVKDGYRAGSYWWVFQALLEAVTAEAGSHYYERQSVVRKHFDQMQQRWIEEADRLPHDAATEDWDDFTAQCTAEALDAAGSLLDGFAAH
jgi:secernin